MCGVNCEARANNDCGCRVKGATLNGAQMIDSEECTTMAQVRIGVDEIDRQLAALVGKRFGFMDAAARVKPEREQVRDEARKAEVIANARENAAANGWPPEVAAAIWERLVEASIAYELAQFDRVRT